jgi:hypothetical protein
VEFGEESHGRRHRIGRRGRIFSLTHLPKKLLVHIFKFVDTGSTAGGVVPTHRGHQRSHTKKPSDRKKGSGLSSNALHLKKLLVCQTAAASAVLPPPCPSGAHVLHMGTSLVFHITTATCTRKWSVTFHRAARRSPHPTRQLEAD